MATRPSYGVEIVHLCDEPAADIVFVHGFRGDRRRTWATRQLKESKPFWKSIKAGGKRRESDETAPGGDVFWPRDLLPFDVPNIRVFTFGYDASIATVMSRSANNSIFSAAQDLIVRLAAARESLRGDSIPIIFVAHSLGGIVVKDGLKFAQDQRDFQPHLYSVFEMTFGIMFFGTPHRGSELASLGHLAARIAGLGLAKNENHLLRALEQGSPELERIADSFSRMLPRDGKGLAVYSFQEGLPVSSLGSKVVESSSSIIGDACEGKSVIHADHMAMCRFASRDNDDYRLVVSVLRRWLNQIGRGKGVVATPYLQSAPPRVASTSGGPTSSTTSSEPPSASNEAEYDQTMHSDGKIDLQNSRLPDKLIPSVPHRNFRGRDDELSWIKATFAAAGKTPGTQRLAVLYGLGGVGKTQVALKYAFQESSIYRAIFWIDASTESSILYGFAAMAQSIVDWAARIQGSTVNFTRIGLELGLAQVVDPATGHVAAKDTATLRIIVDALRRWLSRPENRGWLLVFDSADNLEDVNLPNYFPQAPSGDILITSRQTHAILLGPSLEVKPLSSGDATSILQQMGGFEVEEDKRFCRLIADELGGLPLAITQAGSYLATVKVSPRVYLQLYKAQRVRLLRNRPPMSAWNYQYTVFSTWEVSFGALVKSHPAAAHLLRICSFVNAQSVPYAMFAAASRIDGSRANVWNNLWDGRRKKLVTRTVGWLTKGARSSPQSRRLVLTPIPVLKQLFEHEFGFEHALQAIFELSLASENSNQDGLVIHPLVQTWCQNREESLGSHQYQDEALICVARTIDQSTPRQAMWLQATQHLANCVSILSGFANRDRDCKVGVDILCSMDVVGRALLDTERPGGEGTFSVLHRSLLRDRGERHQLTIYALQRLATAVETETSPEAAEKYFRRAFAHSIRYLGKNHPDTLSIGNNLGTNLILRRRWAEAEPFMWSIHAAKASRDPLGLQTLQTELNLSLCIAAQGRAEEAEVLLNGLLSKLQDADDDEHVHLSVLARGNLALVYCLQRRWDDAERVLIESVARSEEYFGLTHPFTIPRLLSLDGFYRGAQPDVLEVPVPPMQLHKSIATQTRVMQLWDDMDLNLKYMFQSRMFDLYYSIGDMDAAMSILDRFEDALIHRGDGEFLAKAQAEMALSRGLAQWDQGLLGEAIASCTDAMRRFQAMPGREEDVATATMNLGVALRDAGDTAQAEALLVRSRDIESRVSDGRSVLKIDTHLAMLYTATGRWAEAQRLVEETQAGMNESVGPLERFALLNRYATACLHEAKGDVNEAIRVAKQTFDAKMLGMGPEQTATIKTALMLGRLYRRLGREREAAELADKIRPYLKYA